MFREIRRKKNEISIDDAKRLLEKSRRGVLAVNGDDGYPYAIPVNYLFCKEEGKIYFHSSKVGYKIESIKNSDKVCFTVYGNEIIKEENWAPYVQSVVVFGRCRIIDDQEKMINVLKQFAAKYYPSKELIDKGIAVSGRAVQMLEIEVEHISGKEVKEK